MSRAFEAQTQPALVRSVSKAVESQQNLGTFPSADYTSVGVPIVSTVPNVATVPNAPRIVRQVSSFAQQESVIVEQPKVDWAGLLEKHGLRGVVRVILRRPFCEYLFCSVVIANSATIGIEQSFRLGGQELPVFDVLENIFLFVYVLELGLHFFGWGLKCMRSRWVRFYIVLVVLSIVSNLVILPMGTDESRNRLSSLLLLRMVRLLRLARAVRLVVTFREIRLLAVGLLHALKTLIHTLFLGAILVYMLSCVALELIPLGLAKREPPTDPIIRDIIENDFSSLAMTMLTLVQFFTFDNTVHIYKPLMEYDSTLAGFFIPVIGLLGVVFMNLVTATMVSGGLEHAMEDKIMRSAVVQARKKGLLVDLEEAFYLADTNGSGTISRDELADIDENQRNRLQEVLGVDSLTALFDCLDVDHNGELGIEEFIHGIEGILVSQTPVAVKRLERMVNSISQQLKDAQVQHVNTSNALAELASSLSQVVTPFSVRHSVVKDPPVLEESPVAAPSGTPPAPSESHSCHTSLETPEMPAWTAQLVRELKEVCSVDARRAMDEACMEFFARVAGDEYLPQQQYRRHSRRLSSFSGSDGGVLSSCETEGQAERVPETKPPTPRQSQLKQGRAEPPVCDYGSGRTMRCHQAESQGAQSRLGSTPEWQPSDPESVQPQGTHPSFSVAMDRAAWGPEKAQPTPQPAPQRLARVPAALQPELLQASARHAL